MLVTCADLCYTEQCVSFKIVSGIITYKHIVAHHTHMANTRKSLVGMMVIAIK